jgi:hypothetical protein
MMAMVLVNCRQNGPRHGWNKKWGPLVPHRSFPGDCGLCHVPDRWDVLRDDFSFDHEARTGYPLEGAHAQAACLRCHNDRGPVQVYASRGCAGCHPDPHTATLGLDCQRCHDETSWRPTGLMAEHARTRFALMGAHVAAPCESCHSGATAGQFRGAPTQCELCHQADLARATAPNHVANGWVADCERCHTPIAWERSNFVHDFFPLVGGHAGLDCLRCHTNGVLGSIPSDCYSCHATDYAGAPDHASQNFPHTCEQCHSPAAWTPATYTHNSFPLTGGHAGLTCTRCHTGGVLGPIPSDCYSCHATDYAGAPDHASQNFSHTCERCHSTAAWTPATYDHSSFPLTGGHGGLACSQCHPGGTPGTIPSNCYSCHAADYQRAANHATLGFPQTCEQCHTATAWQPATFQHPFPLQSVHNVSCTECHPGGGASSFTCLNCHEHNPTETGGHHAEVNGYIYDSQACYQCHPGG